MPEYDISFFVESAMEIEADNYVDARTKFTELAKQIGWCVTIPDRDGFAGCSSYPEITDIKRVGE